MIMMWLILVISMFFLTLGNPEKEEEIIACTAKEVDGNIF